MNTAEDGTQYVLMEPKQQFFTWKNDLKIETNGVTTDGVSDEKAKQTLRTARSKFSMSMRP